MAEFLLALVPLSNFNSVFELGFAVSAALPAWTALREKAQVEILRYGDEIIENALKDVKAKADKNADPEKKPDTEAASIVDSRALINQEHSMLVGRVKIGSFASASLAVLCAVLLIISGAAPEFYTYNYLAISVSVLALSLVPVLLRSWNTKANKSKKILKEKITKIASYVGDGIESTKQKQPPAPPKKRPPEKYTRY